MRPEIICHMVSSIDARLLAERFSPPAAGVDGARLRRHYDEVYRRFGADGWLVGRVTMEEFAHGAALDPTDFRNTVPRFSEENRKANQALVDVLGAIAARKGVTTAQLALAWVLAQKPWIVPIPGTTKRHRLEENVGAAAVELTADDLREIGAAASQVGVQGERYSEAAQRMINR